MGWFEEFKVALVSNDTKRIAQLIDTLPQFASLEQMQEAHHLLQEAKKRIEALKQATLQEREQIKKSLDYIKSTALRRGDRLDVNS